MLKVIELGQSGIEHFKKTCWGYIDYLDYLKKANSKLINSYTYIPEDYNSPYKIDEYSYGGRYSREDEIYFREKQIFSEDNAHAIPMLRVIAELIEEYMRNGKDLYCYFSEFIHTKDSIIDDMQRCKVKREWKEDYIFLNNQMLYFIDNESADKYNIYQHLIYSGAPSPPHFLGFITDYKPEDGLTDESEFIKVFKGITLLFSGLYDAEGVMVVETNIGKNHFTNSFNNLEIPYIMEKL